MPLSGVELVGNSTRQAALGAFSPGSEARIFFPHYAVGGGTTTQIGIVNTSGSAANVTLNAYDNNADLVGTTSFQIAAGGQFLGSVADVFQIPTTGATQVGYLIAQGDQPGIMGYTDFTYSNGSQLLPTHPFRPIRFQAPIFSFRKSPMECLRARVHSFGRALRW